MNFFDLSGKVAIVTGGAKGLGGGMSLGLAKAGADVAIITSNDKNRDVEKEIQAMGRKAHTIVADLSDENALPGVVNEALAVFGKIDILVNNAGIIRRTPAAEHAAKDWHDVLDLNLNAVFFLCQLVGREMIKQGSGKIINVASMLTYQGGINVPGYTASKHAVAGITKALANEWASKGINVNGIAPGYMSTDNTEAIRADADRSAQILGRIPAGRWGTTEDMQGPVVFLASQAADYMNGHVICVDGGWMAR
jgi:2-deoxy-D-gluconate 3-dehydrogenase